MGVDVLFAVDPELEIRAKTGLAKHYPPLLSFSCLVSFSFSPGFLPRDTVPVVRVGDRRRAEYQKVLGCMFSIPNLSVVFPRAVTAGVARQ
jgi:hypothetical protein